VCEKAGLLKGPTAADVAERRVRNRAVVFMLRLIVMGLGIGSQ